MVVRKKLIFRSLSDGVNGLGPKGQNVDVVRFYHPQFQTILIHSSAKGNVTIVEELARDENVDVNIADTEGNTALIHAAVAGRTLSKPCTAPIQDTTVLYRH